MALELDHVFVLCDAGAPEAVALTRAGFVEGQGNVHPGQGTACRRFFFAFQYLECLWVHDPVEARCAVTAPTRLWERWSARRLGGSPFGLVFRHTDGPDEPLPFPTLSYRPSYLPNGAAIEIARGTPLDEPEFFVLRFPRGSAGGGDTAREPVSPSAVTHLALETPSALTSPAARWAQSAGLLSVASARDHCLAVTFDDHRLGQIADLRPELPMALRW